MPRAIATYKKWNQAGYVAIQGWGTADTEALVKFVADDKIPYFSASYSGHLTDPTGKAPETKTPTPYNFFMAPPIPTACAAWCSGPAGLGSQGRQGKPKYVHMGDNHPYPNAPKKAGEVYAKELGFEVCRRSSTA